MVFWDWLLSLSIMFLRFFHWYIFYYFIYFCCRAIFHHTDDTTFYSYIHQLMNIWIVPTFELLWLILPWPSSWGHMFSLTLYIFLGMELLNYVVTQCLTFWGTGRLFSLEGASISNLSTSSSTLFIVIYIISPSWNGISLWLWVAFLWWLMMSEHLFMGLLDICTSSLEKCLSRFFAHFKLGSLSLLLLSWKSS